MLFPLLREPTAYAGVGSRKTPEDVLSLMGDIAWYLSYAGWTLRTGGADGADWAFLDGCWKAMCYEETPPSPGGLELYLPWPGFGDLGHIGRRAYLHPPGKVYVQDRPSASAYSMAEGVHPSWRQLNSEGKRLLMARNSHQVLGRDLASPVAFVLCWTPDGATETTTRETGGTGQAIRIAASQGIPVYNLKRDDHRAEWQVYVRKHAGDGNG